MLLKITIFVFLVKVIIVSSKVSDKCVLDGENGLCEYLNNCPRALHEFNFEGKLYTRCEAGGREPDPIVCCLRSLQSAVSPQENTNLPISVRSNQFSLLYFQNII